MTENEHEPLEPARPRISERDAPDALRPDIERDTDPDADTERNPDRRPPEGEPAEHVE
jgi:hypothetical protein